MARLARYRVPSSSSLLARVLDAPRLAASIRELQPASLLELISEVGLEDAGELVALTRPEQLHAVFDEDLWRRMDFEEEERFDAKRFVLWLAVMSEAGETFVAECLSEMPQELLILGVSKLVLVLDMDDLLLRMKAGDEQVERSERALGRVQYEEWEEYALIARETSAWDLIFGALLALDRDHHELLRRVLEVCANVSQAILDDEGDLAEFLSEEHIVEGQAADEREERRAKRGYVSSPDARAFLALARRGDPLDERDPITKAYFRHLPPLDVGMLTPSAPAWLEGLRRRAPALLELLPDAGATREPATFIEPAAPDPTLSSPLLVAMQVLRRTHPERYVAVIEELTYLGNVLLAAAGPKSGLKAYDALLASMAVCDLGAARFGEPDDAATKDDAVLVRLRETTADRLFRHGLATLEDDDFAGRHAAALEPFREWLVAARSGASQTVLVTSTAKKILDEALSLPDEDREALVEVLITSLEWDSPEHVERAWSEEIMRRLERNERGESVAVDWDEAKRRIRAKHGFE